MNLQIHSRARMAISLFIAGALCAGCGGGGDSDGDPERLALLEPVAGVIDILLRTNSGAPNYPAAPLASDVLAGTNPLVQLTAGVPFVVIVRATPGNRFLESNLDAHTDPDIDTSMAQDGHDRGGGNEHNLTLRFSVQLGPSSNLPGFGVVPFSTLPAYDGANERAILNRARQIGIPIEDIALPAGFNIAVFLNRNILTSTEFGLASPDDRDIDTRVLLGWKPSSNQLVQASAVGGTAMVDATVLFSASPVGASSQTISISGAAAPTMNLRVRSAAAGASLANAPTSIAVRNATTEITSIFAGQSYVLELEIVPGSAGFDLHRDPEWMAVAPPQSGLVRGGGDESNLRISADRDLGLPENRPGIGIAPYSMLPAYSGSNERAIIDAAIALGIDPFSIALPAGFNMAPLFNRNCLTSDFAGTPSTDARNDAVVVLSSLASGVGGVATAALAGSTITFTASVDDRAGQSAAAVDTLAVMLPIVPTLDLTLRTQSARPSLANAPLASEILVETAPIMDVGVDSPFEIFLEITPGSAGFDLHTEPDIVTGMPIQSGLERGGGNELRVSIVADRQLGPSFRLPGAGAPPYSSLPFFTGANERAIVDAAIALGIDPTSIALPANFDLAVFINRNVLSSSTTGQPSPDTRNPVSAILAGHHVGVEQGAGGALLGDTITITATVFDLLGSMAMDVATLMVRATAAPTVALRARTDSGIASLSDAPTVSAVDAASVDLMGVVNAGAPFTLIADITPGDGRFDAHVDPDLAVTIPPQSGLVRGGGNELFVDVSCDLQLGAATNLPGVGAPPYDALPLYDGANERAIVDAAIAMGIDPLTVALPAGFNLAPLLARNILTTDASGAPSPDARVPSVGFSLAIAFSMSQSFDPALAGSMATFQITVTDEIGATAMANLILQIP